MRNWIAFELPGPGQERLPASTLLVYGKLRGPLAAWRCRYLAKAMPAMVTALMGAACQCHLDVVKYLFGERGAATNAKTTDDTTALMVAAGLGHLDVVKYLAGERGATTDARTADGMELQPDAKCPVSGSPKSTFKMHVTSSRPLARPM
jgi:hypothetical protein